MELFDILNDVPEESWRNMEKVVIDICCDSDLEVEPNDIEGCHRLTASRCSRGSNERVIVKFVN